MKKRIICMLLVFIMVAGLMPGMKLMAYGKDLVCISAVDMTCGMEMAGVTMQIMDEEDNVLAEWVSTDDTYVNGDLPVGVTYTVRTTAVPKGYTIPEDTTFTIRTDGSIVTTGLFTVDGVLLVGIFPLDKTEKSYVITLPDVIGGTVETDKDEPLMGEMVTITVTPDMGKEVAEIIVKDDDDNDIPVTKNPDGTYSYEQPACDVEVFVELKAKKYKLIWSNGDGGSYEQEVDYGKTITVPSNEFFNDTMNKSGYTLTGWTNTEGYNVGDLMPGQEITFTAQYTAIPGEKPDDSKPPQTGNNSNMILWITLLFVSGIGIYEINLHKYKAKER